MRGRRRDGWRLFCCVVVDVDEIGERRDDSGDDSASDAASDAAHRYPTVDAIDGAQRREEGTMDARAR